MVVKRFDVYLVISPDEMNRHMVVGPMTTQGRSYPTRVSCRFQGKAGQVVLDQIGTIDKTRLVRRIGRVGLSTQKAVLTVLTEMFAE